MLEFLETLFDAIAGSASAQIAIAIGAVAVLLFVNLLRLALLEERRAMVPSPPPLALTDGRDRVSDEDLRRLADRMLRVVEEQAALLAAAEARATAAAEATRATPAEPLVPMVAVSAPQSADDIIKSYVIAAMTVGMVPIPLFDIAALIALQTRMVQQLSALFRVPFNRALSRSLILSLLTSGLPVLFGAGLASAFKAIPGAGSLVGGAGSALLSGAVTWAVGRVFADHFELGGTVFDMTPRHLRARFGQAVREGRKVSREISGKRRGREAVGSPSAPTADPIG